MDNNSMDAKCYSQNPNLKCTLTILENNFIYNLNSGNRKLHPLSSTLPAAANSILPTAWPSSPADQQLRAPQHCFVNMLQANKSKDLKLFQSSNPWAVTCATSPICACQVCVGSDKLALLHSTPTPQSTAIIFPYAISRSLPHLSLPASALSATDEGHEQTNISASHTSLPQKLHMD